MLMFLCCYVAFKEFLFGLLLYIYRFTELLTIIHIISISIHVVVYIVIYLFTYLSKTNTIYLFIYLI